MSGSNPIAGFDLFTASDVTASSISIESINDALSKLPKAGPAFEIWCTQALMDAIRSKYQHLADPATEFMPGVQIIACLPPEAPKQFIKVPCSFRYKGLRPGTQSNRPSQRSSPSAARAGMGGRASPRYAST